MGEQAPESQGIAPESQGSVAPENSGQEQGTGNNPAWNDLLGVIPSQLHSQVTPHLSKWDQGVQQKIQQVHSQYEPYKYYLDNKIEPDNINYALNLVNAIEERPQEVMKALQDWIGNTEGNQGQGNGAEQQGLNQPEGSEETPDWLNHPKFQEMQQMVEQMAQLLVQQQETSQQTEADTLLENELKSVRDELGDFDEEWVLTKMYNNPNMEMKDAVQAYQNFEKGLLSKARQPGPQVLSPGGQIPSQELNPSGLDPKGRRNLVVQMLQNSAQQNQ